jgi:hypothetical protein
MGVVRSGTFAFAVAAGACGHTVASGELVNTINVTHTRFGDAPVDVASAQFVPDSFQRVRTGDLTGDAVAEELLELPRGRGVQIRAAGGGPNRVIETDEYLTDFGTLGGNLVLYTYPNPSRGGTFRIVTPSGTELVRWSVHPPPGQFDVAPWNGAEAIAYLQGDEVVVQSATGEELRRLPAPQGSKFRSIYLEPGVNGATIVLASGNGYTPAHMVAVYDATGTLRYQNVVKEHAFRLEARQTEPAFRVVTRTSILEYRYQP